jgi:hypothetical protein
MPHTPQNAAAPDSKRPSLASPWLEAASISGRVDGHAEAGRARHIDELIAPRRSSRCISAICACSSGNHHQRQTISSVMKAKGKVPNFCALYRRFGNDRISWIGAPRTSPFTGRHLMAVVSNDRNWVGLGLPRAGRGKHTVRLTEG